MNKNYTLLLFVISSFISYAQYCTNVGPSSTVDSNVESVILNGASGSISYTGCPGVVGLQDLTSLSTILNAGSNYTLQVEFGTCGGPYAGVGQAWIDFNQSGTFEPTESLGTWQGTPPALPQSFNFTVPIGSQNGPTRMRVIQQEAGTLPINPCGTFTWGSVMDFTINIGNGVDCSGYTGDDTNDPIIVSNLPFIDTNDNSYCYSNQNLVYNSSDVYYQLNPSPMMESVAVSLCGSSFDTFLSVVDGFGNVIAYNDDVSGCGTQSGLTFNTDGLGMVYIIVEGWGNASGEYILEIDGNYLNTVDLNEENILIYPNPANNFFELKNYNGEIKIYDLAGKKVKEIKNYFGDSIDLSDIKSGVYQIQISVNNELISKKLIKNDFE
jgi:hypothetical protein